jgi:hypothetical protein
MNIPDLIAIGSLGGVMGGRKQKGITETWSVITSILLTSHLSH